MRRRHARKSSGRSSRSVRCLDDPLHTNRPTALDGYRIGTSLTSPNRERLPSVIGREFKKMDAAPSPIETEPIAVMSLEDFMAAKFEADPDLVDGIIPGHGLIALAAKPKAGKTSLALDLCTATRAGSPFLGRPTRQVRTLFIGEEGGPAGIQKRLKSLMSEEESPAAPAGSFGIAMRQRVRLDTPDGIARLDDAIYEAAPSLVVLDCLVRMHRLAENDARDMAALMESLEELAAVHQTAVLFIHHLGKVNESGAGGYAMRGSGVLASSTEANLILRRTASRATLTGELRESADLRMNLEFNEATLQFRPGAAVVPRGKPSSPRVLEALDLMPGSTIDQIAKSLSTSDTSLRPIFTTLVSTGEISMSPASSGRGHVYRLAA